VFSAEVGKGEGRLLVKGCQRIDVVRVSVGAIGSISELLRKCGRERRGGVYASFWRRRRKDE